MIQLMQGDCLERMKEIPDGGVQLTVTSPPYDHLRDYNNKIGDSWNFDIFKNVAAELFRVTMDGGCVVWIVNDATIEGSESGTSFRQALYFKEIGFRLFDTMIWHKLSPSTPNGLNRYAQVFEYMFVFSKGKPSATNILRDKKNKTAGNICRSTYRQKDNRMKKDAGYGVKITPPYGRRYNVWEIPPAVSKTDRSGHPAPFPVALARDHILTWSNEGDTILDPFMGSGSTGVACINTNRGFIGIELDESYFKMAQARIETAQAPDEGAFFIP